MRKSFIAFSAALALLPFAARGNVPADLLIVNLKNQQNVHFALSELPELNFSGNTLTITTSASTGNVSYDLADIADISFASSSAVDLPSADATFEIIDNVVTVRGINADASATVTDSAGRTAISIKADASGCAVMDLRSLSAGVYIIRADRITYKYSKRP
ncbi:MAG: hypothetical protein K2K36_00935 [Muribaculaceae bacterium]|nr:hypothetical protein [Muribaculaceae bacterium]